LPNNLSCNTVDGVAILSLDNPPVNALSIAVWTSIDERVDQLGDDASISAVILTANGRRAFSAGADLNEWQKLNKDERQQRQEFVTRILFRWIRMPVPVICAINGPVVGEGLNLAVACDFRFAAHDAHFSMPEIDLGLVGGSGALFRRIGVPAGFLREMLFTGRRFTSDEALEAHLIDRVGTHEAILAMAHSLARDIASKSSSVLRLTKKAVLQAEAQSNWVDAYLAAQDAGKGEESLRGESHQ
jgi:enoyl-CoA hydratase